MATDKKPTMLRLDDAVREKLRYIAYADRRSLNAEIEYAIDFYIRTWEAANGPIPDAPSPKAPE